VVAPTRSRARSDTAKPGERHRARSSTSSAPGGIGHRALNDLRDTFASQLLTAGVQLGYVSSKLGHSDVAVTARHYAKWAGGEMYRGPIRLKADVFLPTSSRSSSSPIGSPKGWATEVANADANPAEFWRAQHDSNMRPSGPQPGRRRR